MRYINIQLFLRFSSILLHVPNNNDTDKKYNISKEIHKLKTLTDQEYTTWNKINR